jgi:hypothetical protein
VAKVKQPWLPKLKVARVVDEKFPQPRTEKIERPKKFELLHHPFDLRFRGRLSEWLSQIEIGTRDQNLSGGRLELEEILGKEDVKIIKLYFFPQGAKKRWLNQEEVLKRTQIPYKKKLKKNLIESLMKIWSETKT